MAVGIDVRVAGSGLQKDDFGGFHRVVCRENEAQCVLFVLVHTAGGSCDGDEPFVNSIGFGNGHAGDGGGLDGPFGQLPGESALRNTSEFFPTMR